MSYNQNWKGSFDGDQTAQEIEKVGVTSTAINDGAVTSTKLANNAVTTTKIANDAVTLAKLAANAVTTSKIGDNEVTLAKIAPAAKPILHVVAMGEFTTAGGDANESITAAGVLGTDTALVFIKKAGTTPRTITTVTPGAGSIAVVLSGDPSTDHVLGYIVTRAAA